MLCFDNIFPKEFWNLSPSKSTKSVGNGQQKVRKGPRSIDIEHRAITPAILERIFEKMHKDTVVKFSMASRRCSNRVETIGSPELFAYVRGKEAKQAVYKTLGCNSTSLSGYEAWAQKLDSTVRRLERMQQNLEDMRRINCCQNEIVQLAEESHKREKDLALLLRQVLDNWGVMEKEEKRIMKESQKCLP